MSRERLGVVHVDSAHEWRGSQNQVLLAALGMAARGHAVTVACRAGGRLEERARRAGLPVRPLRFGGDLAPGAILGLARVLKEVAPDVVHAHDPHATSASLLAARLAGGPRVLASRRVPLGLRGTLSPRKYAACDRVLAVSGAIARVLLAAGLPPERLELVRDGVPDRPPVRDGRDVLGELGIPAGAPVVGNVAALTEHKDHGTLLAAMPRVLAAFPEARLVIVGAGRLREPLEAEARRLGLEGSCVFTGFRSDVDRLIPAFSVACLTSRAEGLGTSLLDAMCFARPIVATATGGIPEAVEHGRTGLLVPVGDSAALAEALVALLQDADRREILGAAGRRRFLQRFTADRMTEETLAVYARVVGAVRRVGAPAELGLASLS